MKTVIEIIAQMHSADYFVRIKPSELCRIVFTHFETMEEPSVCAESHEAAIRCGMTEWQGSFHDQIISLGWDWALLASGGVVLVREVPPRTNVKLIDERGYDVQDDHAGPHLYACIARLRWAEEVRQSLHLGGTNRLSH